MTQSNDLPVISQVPVVVADSLSTDASAYAQASPADNTKPAYRADWKHFTTWCLE